MLFNLLGVVFLILVHELGHAFVAFMLGHKVHGLAISFDGGFCLHSRTPKLLDNFLVFIAGVLAQFVLLMLTLLYLYEYGEPTSSLGNSLAMCFLPINLLLMCGNLIPSRSKSDLPTDGYWIWQIIKYRLGKAPNPFPRVASKEEAVVFSPDTSLLTKEHMIPAGFKTGIEILNDETTPMEVVVECLMKYLCLKREWAVDVMIKIHNEGGTLIEMSSLDSARVAANAITEASKQKGYTLVCRAVSISG